MTRAILPIKNSTWATPIRIVIKPGALIGAAYSLWATATCISRFWLDPTGTRANMADWFSGVLIWGLILLLFLRLYALRSWAAFPLLMVAALLLTPIQTWGQDNLVIARVTLSATLAFALVLWMGIGQWKHHL